MLLSFAHRFFHIFKTKKRDNGLEYASYALRYIAMIVDLVFILVFIQILDMGFRYFLRGFYAAPEIVERSRFHLTLNPKEKSELLQHVGMHYFLQVSEFFILYAYNVFFVKKFGGTPAKLILGMRVISTKTYQFPSRKLASKRFLTYLISVVPVGLGILWGAFDKNSQMLHDKICSTIVVRKQSLVSFYRHSSQLDSSHEAAKGYVDPLDQIIQKCVTRLKSYVSKSSTD